MKIPVVDLSGRPLSCPHCDAPLVNVQITPTGDKSAHVRVVHEGSACWWWKSPEAPVWCQLVLYRQIKATDPV